MAEPKVISDLRRTLTESNGHFNGMLKLSIKLWPEDDVWIAKCLDLPGCVTDGDTEAEAVDNIQEAISGVLNARLSDVCRGLKFDLLNRDEIIKKHSHRARTLEFDGQLV